MSWSRAEGRSLLDGLGVRAALALGTVATVTGCGSSDGAEQLGQQQQDIPAPLPAAFCDVVVTGKGTKSMEDDYLPHVITCENGGANLEALKAQAVAARSVAYYNMTNDGYICDSQGCQVYGCGATPSAKAYQAVAETSGLYLSYDSLLTYGFYVDGDHDTAPPSCVGRPDQPRENYITYNEGKSGADVKMTTLGYIPPGAPIFGQNRGCMSQWGARCLENDRGYGWQDILRFYYGADIQILQAPGSCVTPTDRDPEGYLDAADCSSVRGWAWDPDTPATALEVRAYADQAATPVASGSAAESRADLCSAIGSCEHGFELATPQALLDGNAHELRVVAVDAGGAEHTLAGSPRTITCAPGGAGGSAGGSGGSGAGGGAAAPGGSGGSAGGAAPGPGAGGQPGDWPGAAGASGAGAAGDSSTGDPGSSPQTRVVSEDGGGCSLSRGRREINPCWLLVLGGLVPLWRRRRRFGMRAVNS